MNSNGLSVPVTALIAETNGLTGVVVAWDGYSAGTGSPISDAIDLTYYNAYSINVTCTAVGSPVGTLQLQVSANAFDWTNSGSSVAVSGATTAYWESAGTGAKAVRVKYTRTSGSIDLYGVYTVK